MRVRDGDVRLRFRHQVGGYIAQQLSRPKFDTFGTQRAFEAPGFDMYGTKSAESGVPSSTQRQMILSK